MLHPDALAQPYSTLGRHPFGECSSHVPPTLLKTPPQCLNLKRSAETERSGVIDSPLPGNNTADVIAADRQNFVCVCVCGKLGRIWTLQEQVFLCISACAVGVFFMHACVPLTIIGHLVNHDLFY